ncbi:DNA polymerase III subunit gamma/tau [Emergencia sp. 1XD21-10]|uniref:DNA polymerase III subunit gamma/tau n=1 Tax=Emergencia sp. 1XD21-10 TaxID=2304569 RepID=UPI00137AC5E4|nr:DNA polymerase III subunit gamma/tau [Emergencia sp. 1XD21-10]NCE98775.1 DNA polymerase III subunit gamma/tau [Emergencia sp. 1XD21-10]
MYTALYRAQRPEVFSEVIGQDHIVRILKNQIQTGTVSHAYLFCGTRGTGKTTTARILAKAVNCLTEEEKPCGHCANCMAIKDGTFMDVIEIDAASNNGVDNIRELRESVKYPPAVGRKKVYIIDEVHMLSTGAFNALLKTLEEPPENVIFILATTDPQKLPQTILSRCMRLDFKRVPEKVLIDHMGRICAEKGIEITERALRLLAANADGSVRDGLSILDQCLSAGDRKLDRDIILEFLGTVSEEFFINLTDKVSLHDVAGALVILDEALQEGKDVKQLMKDWMSHYRSLLITKYIKNAEDMLNMSTENIEKLRAQSGQISLDEINSGIVTLSRTINDARYSSQPRILLELAIVTIASGLTEAAPIGKSVRQVQQASVRPQGQPQMAQPAPVGAAAAPLQQPQAASVQAAASAQVVLEENGAGNALQQQPQTVQIPNYDLDEIWERIFEEGEDIKGSFNLIRTGAVLAEINDSQFKVIAQNAFTKQYVESNQQQICQLMEKITGKNLKLVCKTEEQNEEVSPHRQEAEQLASEVRSKLDLGVDITIK